MKAKNTISHRDRKNPKSREAYETQRRAKNEARGKQVFDQETKTWSR